MRRQSRDCGGFSYIEVLLAIMILAGAVTSLSYALGVARDLGMNGTTTATAEYLVQDGILWACGLNRCEPKTPDSFGPESGEKANSYDDVDDLDGYTEAPPVDQRGFKLPVGWQRSFTVDSVDPNDPRVTSAKGSTSLMRVTITVTYNGGDRAKAVLLLWRFS